MRILIACDIHGLTLAVRELFAPLGEALTFLSQWDGEGCPYASEAEAVQAFHAQDGLRRYGEKIARTLQGEAVFLVGLSVGASSVRQYLASPACAPGSEAVLYYGSRIRDLRALRPNSCSPLVKRASTRRRWLQNSRPTSPRARCWPARRTAS